MRNKKTRQAQRLDALVEACCPEEIKGQSICVDGDIGDVLVMLQS